MICPHPRKKYIYICGGGGGWGPGGGGDGAPEKSIVKIEANKEKPQII